MYDDDSRGLESPARPHASPTTDDRAETRARRLSIIDAQAAKLLEDLEDARADEYTADGYTADRPISHEAARHLREIRAEVAWVRRLLATADGLAADPPTSDSREVIDGVPMVVRRGRAVTSVLGPDPVAFEQLRGRERGGDSSRDLEADRDRDRKRGDRDA